MAERKLARLSPMPHAALRLADAWHDTPYSVFWIPVVLVGMLLVCSVAVYATGGTHTAAPHIVYVPIFLAAAWYGMPGGALAGVLGGLALGPFMPLDVTHHVPQSLLNWLVRLGFLTLFGTLAGLVMALIRDYAAMLWEYAFVSRDNQLPTINRLVVDVEQRPLARLLVISISNFDHLAHTVGLATAQQLPDTLRTHLAPLLPPDAYCYELGARRLAIAFFNPESATTLDERLLTEQLTAPLPLGNYMIYAEATLGQYVPATDTERDAEELVRRASSALLNGRNRKELIPTYTPQLDADTRENMRLLASLRTGLNEGRVFLVYQPKIDLASGAVAGVEALVRLIDTDSQTVPPGRFIPLAEQSSVIHPLTDSVITQAITQFAQWRRAGFDFRLAINFSARNLQSPRALQRLANQLTQHAIPPDRVEIEVTESALIEDPDAFHHILQQAREMRVKLSIDDFGTGYTTLGYLSVLPVDIIKIDRSLIQPMVEAPRRAAVVHSIIALCQNLDLRVIAEGVETEAIYQMLKAAGCDAAQGYLIARPMPAAELLGWIEAWHQKGENAPTQ